MAVRGQHLAAQQPLQRRGFDREFKNGSGRAAL
jgi:hypothetical protein